MRRKTKLLFRRIFCAVYFCTFIDILLFSIVFKKNMAIALKRTRIRYPLTQSAFTFLKFFLFNFYFELKSNRISTSQNYFSIRSIYWANLRFARLMELSEPDTRSDTDPVLWEMMIDGENLLVRLEYNTRPSVEEGDFRLILYYENTAVHSITFSFGSSKFFNLGHGDVILVGGNQGCSHEHSGVRSLAARAFHDISAKDILILTIIGIGRAVSSPSIFFVGIETHSSNLINPRFNEYKATMENLYDPLWRSYGATNKSGFYVLDLNDKIPEKSSPNGRNKGRKLRKRQVKNNLTLKVKESFSWSTPRVVVHGKSRNGTYPAND